MEKVYYSKDSKLSPYSLAQWLNHNTVYFVCGNRFYLWNDQHHFFEMIPKTAIPPWVISRISPKYSGEIRNSVIDEATKTMLRAPDNQINLVEKTAKSQFLLNLRNGVYDLNQGKLISGEEAISLAKEMCFTYALDFSYIEGASLDKAPVFRRFLETSLEVTACAEKQALLLEIIGICISSVQIARKFYFFVGATKSGKSVIADLLHRIVHPELAVTAFGLNQLSGRFNVQHLEYSRLNLCRELTAGKVTGTDTLKMLVSDEPMFVEGKGKEGKLPEKDITDEKSSVKKQKTKVSFPVSDDENVRLGEMAQRAGKTKSQFMHDRVFTPETPDIILPQGDDIRVLLADISDKLTDITDILNEKRNLNILQVKEELDRLILSVESIREKQVMIELKFSTVLMLDRLPMPDNADDEEE